MFVQRSLGQLFDAGTFDPLEGKPYAHISFEAISSEASKALALDASRQALVLLKNRPPSSPPDFPPAQPLAKTAKVLLVGPHAPTTQDLGGNYFEDICPKFGLGKDGCTPSVATSLEKIMAAGGGAKPTVVPGCPDTNCAKSSFPLAKAAAEKAEAVVLALRLVGRQKFFANTDASARYEAELAAAGAAAFGSSGANTDGTEGEGHDRTLITLPDGQLALLEAVLSPVAPSAKVVVVLFNGGGLAIEKLMADDRIHAVVEAFYPGRAGAAALAETLFGESSRFSKMPCTLLRAEFCAESAMKDMGMTDGVGRGYRYYKGKATIVPFGFGLSYISFSLRWSGGAAAAAAAARPMVAQLSAATQAALTARRPPPQTLKGSAQVLATVSCVVTNTGKVHGDEVVFLPQRQRRRRRLVSECIREECARAAGPARQKQLIGFERVRLAAGASTTVHFKVSARSLSTVAADGARQLLMGEHGLILSRGHREVLRRTVEVRGAVGGRLVLEAATASSE